MRTAETSTGARTGFPRGRNRRQRMEALFEEVELASQVCLDVSRLNAK